MDWFTADHHWGHANIIRYDGRPYEAVEEMDADLIARWNAAVAPGDTVYHLGDIFLYAKTASARAVREQLHGNIRLIRGNHDKNADAMKEEFDWIKDYHELKVPDPDAHGGTQLLVLCHYAFRVWNRSHHGAFHLYGHSHGSLPDDPHARSFDVGCMLHDYRPISYARVKEIMAQKQWQPVDHHRG